MRSLHASDIRLYLGLIYKKLLLLVGQHINHLLFPVNGAVFHSWRSSTLPPGDGNENAASCCSTADVLGEISNKINRIIHH